MKKHYMTPTLELVDMETTGDVMLVGSIVYESDATGDVLSRDFDYDEDYAE